MAYLELPKTSRYFSYFFLKLPIGKTWVIPAWVMQSLLGSCMGVMVIKIWKTEHFNIVFQCFRALLLKGSEKNYLLKCRDGVRETLSHPCVFLDNSQGCTSSRQFWWVLQVLLHQFLPKEKGWGTEWLVWNCMNCIVLLMLCQKPGRDHSYASSYSSYAKKTLSWLGVGLSVYLFTTPEFLLGI